MAQTQHVEMREGEDWQDIANSFMTYSLQKNPKMTGGCHEGDPIPSTDGRRYAAISVPDHSLYLLEYLREWAARDGRSIQHKPIA